jgi:hypothetical protein
MPASSKAGESGKESTMAEDAAKMDLVCETQGIENLYCEYPGCVKRGSLGYDVGDGEIQFFCQSHQWNDYRNRKARRSFFDEEAKGIEAIMVQPRHVAV